MFDEIFLEIFKYLPLNDLDYMKSVSKRFKRLIEYIENNFEIDQIENYNFIRACKTNKVEVVKYLLFKETYIKMCKTSIEIKEYCCNDISKVLNFQNDKINYMILEHILDHEIFKYLINSFENGNYNNLNITIELCKSEKQKFYLLGGNYYLFKFLNILKQKKLYSDYIIILEKIFQKNRYQKYIRQLHISSSYEFISLINEESILFKNKNFCNRLYNSACRNKDDLSITLLDKYVDYDRKIIGKHLRDWKN